MLTTSDSILQFLKPLISKSKSCFENLVKRLLHGTLKLSKIKLEVFLNWISKKCLKVQKEFCTMPPPPPPSPPGNISKTFSGFSIQRTCQGMVGVEEVVWCKDLFCFLRHFFGIQFINTSNLLLLRFKVTSESFFTRFFKQVLLFEICGFKNCKIESEVVNILMGHCNLLPC